MSICDSRRVTGWAGAALGLVVWMVAASPARAQAPIGLGRSATSADVEAWGPIIGPAGEGLPPGGATARDGLDVYRRRCTRCHGPTGTEGPDDRLVGGVGTLASAAPQKTVGSYWPFATTLWDYIARAMPFDEPGSLTTREIYGAVAYVLYLNGIVGEDALVDDTSLPAITMPNRNGFVPDPRPDPGT